MLKNSSTIYKKKNKKQKKTKREREKIYGAYNNR